MTDEAPEFPWAAGKVLASGVGFRITVGNCNMFLGYSLWEGGQVLLMVHQQISEAPTTVWRRFWTSRESAVDQAELLCDEVEEFMESLGGVIRTYEDLDLDDFIHHITLSTTHGLH